MKTLLLLSLCLGVPALASNTYIPKTSQLPQDSQEEAAEEEESYDRSPASEDRDTLKVKKRSNVNNDDGDEEYIKR